MLVSMSTLSSSQGEFFGYSKTVEAERVFGLSADGRAQTRAGHTVFGRPLRVHGEKHFDTLRLRFPASQLFSYPAA